MLRVVIIDDEKKARHALRQMIEISCPTVSVLSEADGVETGLEAISKYKPDVILLDIKMKDGSGFDLVKKLMNVDSKIIFVTAYHEFAVKAFKFSAIDYLLKPVDPDDLAFALKKAEESINKEKNNKYLESLLENFAGTAKQMKKIVLKTATSIFILNISDILYCRSDGNYTEFHCSDGRKPLVSRPIGEYEEMLTEYNFIRTHHSYLINLAHANRFDKNDGGAVLMSNGESTPVSARKKDVLLDALNKL
ncbi:MAG: response regulator transcription factor [Bacteroidia bacterium]|nr:response regulator transcription factor [Bacteroidia bacterium]